MTKTQPQFLTVGDPTNRRDIAFRAQNANTGPDTLGIIFMAGLMSDMESTKATALSEWAPAHGYNLTRFDYSGHGSSQGKFEEATIGDWLEEAREVFFKQTDGPQIFIGSSTGGYVSMLLLRELIKNHPKESQRVKALVLIAPAWDLTQDLMWDAFGEDARRQLMEKGIYEVPTDYENPYRISRRFIEEGKNHLFERRPFNPGRPVVILQGQLDDSVPPQHSRDLMDFLEGGYGHLIEVEDAGHSLSRTQDLELLFNTIDGLKDSIKPTSGL